MNTDLINWSFSAAKATNCYFFLAQYELNIPICWRKEVVCKVDLPMNISHILTSIKIQTDRDHGQK